MKNFTKFASILFLSLSFTAAGKTDFILIGDTGQDNEGQKMVSQSLHDFCRSEKCDFGVLAGDNVYPSGVRSSQDPILSTLFDKYYNTLNFPFLVALGNHDYGSRLPSWQRGAYQINHFAKNPAFHLPSHFYTQTTKDVVFAVIDTTRLVWRKDEEAQGKMLVAARQEAVSTGKWFMVVGHHPYLSNGSHGNAGKYEGISYPPQISGSHLKAFIEEYVCGKADFYLSGHDHNLQVIDGKIAGCDTQFIVSGSGASTKELGNRNRAVFTSESLGYFHLSVTPQKVRIRAINEKAESLFDTNFVKNKNRRRF